MTLRLVTFFLLGFAFFLVPIGIQARKAAVELSSLHDNESQTLQQIENVNATLHLLGPREAAVREKARTLAATGAEAPMTAIQGSFDHFTDVIAREEGVGIGNATCQQDVAPVDNRPGLEGIDCTTIPITGTYVRILDTIRRLTSDAPVIVDEYKANLKRNMPNDASADPKLAATISLRLERVAPAASAAPAAGGGAVTSPAPSGSPSPAPTSTAQ